MRIRLLQGFDLLLQHAQHAREILLMPATALLRGLAIGHVALDVLTIEHCTLCEQPLERVEALACHGEFARERERDRDQPVDLGVGEELWASVPRLRAR